HLSNGARRAWEAFLKLDSSSAWAGEARAHRAALDAPNDLSRWTEAKRDLLRLTAAGDVSGSEAFIKRFPGLARTYARDELFPEWAEATLKRETERSRQLLFACQTVGSALDRLHGDRFLLDAVQAVNNAGGATMQLDEA